MSFFKKSLNIQNTPILSKPKFQSDFLHSLLGPISTGTTILIEEDKYTTHHYMFIKTFIAQNSFYNILVISKDYESISIPDYNTNTQEERNEDLQIAFRYENLKLYSNEKKYDLKTKMSLKDKSIKFIKLEKNINCFISLIEDLETNSIVILPSFLSPIWHIAEKDKYIFEIKRIIKTNKLILIATIPTFLNSNNVGLYFDLILKLQSYPFTNKLMNYSGIIELKKIYNLGNEHKKDLETLKFGYCATRYGLEFEDISLPPEENQTSGCSVSAMF